MFVVTGATGNTGSAVALHLLAEGKKVRAIGRSAQRLQALAKIGGEPFTADLTDTAALTQAFRGAEGVYVMIPPNPGAPRTREYQRSITESIASALENSRVQHAVTLSSIGADKAEGTGPVLGLHDLEQRLNRIAGLNVLHLRAGYFMENVLLQLGVLHETGVMIGALDPDLRLPMIAAHDIGDAAAQALLKGHYGPHESRELFGPEDISKRQVAALIGAAIGKPDLKYVQAPPDQLRSSLLRLRMSEDFVASMLEMWAALNSGHMRALEQRTQQNTAPTYFARWVHDEFLPRYRAARAAA